MLIWPEISWVYEKPKRGIVTRKMCNLIFQIQSVGDMEKTHSRSFTLGDQR